MSLMSLTDGVSGFVSQSRELEDVVSVCVYSTGAGTVLLTVPVGADDILKERFIGAHSGDVARILPVSSALCAGLSKQLPEPRRHVLWQRTLAGFHLFPPLADYLCRRLQWNVSSVSLELHQTLHNRWSCRIPPGHLPERRMWGYDRCCRWNSDDIPHSFEDTEVEPTRVYT